MIAAWLFGALWAAASEAPAQRAWLAELSLSGPLDSVVLDLGDAGSTRIEGPLVAGETRSIVVPLPARDRGERSAPTIACAPAASDASERARFVRWLDEEADPRVVAPLASRSRPPISRAGARARASTLALVAACLPLALALRRRRWIAASFAIVASGAIAWLASAAAIPTVVRVVVEEGDGESWVVVDSARDRIHVAARDLHGVRVESEPAGARLSWRVPLAPGAACELSGSARLSIVRAFDPDARAFSPSTNDWGALAEAWVREDGAWTARGSWERGAPLPPPTTTEREPPPGWLTAGLPQGPRVLLGRIRSEDRDGDRDGDRDVESFVRLVGF